MKLTPRARRGMGDDHTAAWLKGDRQKAWDEHESTLQQSRARKQDLADQLARKRNEDWSDYHQQEAERTARRDGMPSPRQERIDGMARSKEQAGFDRQAQMDALAHPPHLQQAADERSAGQERQRILDEASHPAHLQQRRQEKS